MTRTFARLSACALALAWTMGHAAAQAVSLKLDSLRPPASPAFVLLDVAPSTIQRPTTPRAVAFGLASSAVEAGGLPKNYAVAFAPYWLTSHPRLTLDAYEHGGLAANVARTLDFSFASAERAKDSTGTPLPGTRLGWGVRALPLKGVQSDSVPILLDSIRSIHKRCLLVDDTEGCITRADSTIHDLVRRTQREMRDRYGWTLEVAGGMTLDFPNDDYARGRGERIGVWITPGYRAQHSPMQNLFVLRYIRDLADVDQNTLDFGGRVYWEWKQAALSGEVVQRWSGPDWTNTQRVTGTVEFQITGDLYATYSIGRDFAPPAGGDNRLVSILGVNLGIGSKPSLLQSVAPR
jgi:hypothetical protein